jgi:hypothetical protein
MKHYPSITKEVYNNINFYWFDKLDGSQIRAEYNRKRGFYKFGSKNQLIDASTKPWGIALSLIQDKYGQEIDRICQAQHWDNLMAFFELWGSSSFAGNHNWEEQLTVTLFDVNVYKQGIMEPQDFLQYFGHLDHPKLLHTGSVSVELFDQIKQSTLSGMTLEGVVAKAPSQNQAHLPLMFKVKSNAWLDKLKTYCRGDNKLFDLLS